MNKKLCFFLAIFFYQLNFGQSACGINNITTNPISPYNPIEPSYVNHFDWTTNSPSYNINSTCSPNTFTTNPFQSNQLELLPLSLSKDMKPIDGWETVAYNLGYDNNNIALNTRPEHTYVMLYNKYTGILRILVKWCRNQNYNGALMTLKFAPGFQTNVLDMANDDKALDAPHIPNPSLSTALKFYNDNTSWSYADFKLNYDPCTCSFSESARLALYTELITNSSVQLTGQITGDITSISNGQGSANSDGNFWKSANSINDNMMKVHKGINNFKDNYKEIYKKLADGGVTVNAINQVGSFLSTNSFMKAGLAALPAVSEAFKFISSFFGGGVDGSAAPGPIELAPLSVNLDVSLKGTITTSDPMHNVTIGLPGSQKQNILTGVTGGQPLYNETLGVFSLINTPTMYYTEYSTCDFFNLQYGSSCPSSRNYKFSGETLKYAINPASKLALQDAQVMLIIEYVKPSIIYLRKKLLVAPPSGSFSLINFDLNNGLTIAGTSTGPMVNNDSALFQNSFQAIDLNRFKNDYSFNYKIEDYGEANFSNFLCDGCSLDPGFLLPKIKGFKLKFILNLKRTDNPNAQNVLHVVTYPVQLKPAPAGYNMTGSNYVNDALLYATQGSSNTTPPSNKIIPITSTDLNAFCIGSLYKPNRISTTGKQPIASSVARNSLNNEYANEIIREERNKPILYPVPAKNTLNITLNNCTLIAISNAYGTILNEHLGNEKNEKNTITIDISTFNKGVYILKYLDNNGVINNTKFIVE